jgi:glycine cleavage system transcriptional repressor
MAHVAVTALGADRPGIVAAVTRVLFEQGANLEDTSMSILRGHFSMMLVVAVPAGTTAADLEAALAPIATEAELVLAVRDIDDDVPRSPDGDAWTVSVYGADKPGIVHRVASALAGLNVNIVDLTTRVVGDEAAPVYAMLVDVTLPAGLDPAAVEAALAGLAEEMAVEISLHPSDADIL